MIKSNPNDSFDRQNEHCAQFAGAQFARCMDHTAPDPAPRAPRAAAPGAPAPAPEPVVVTVTREDLQKLPVQPGRMSVQPARTWVLVHMPTIVYAQDEPQQFDVTILGSPVRVRVEPDQYAWDFGEGATLVTADPGAPYPDETVSHTYTRTTAPGETRTIRLTTTWVGEYSVDGGPWEPVDGTVTTSLASAPFNVDEARSELTLPGSDGR